MATGLRGSAWRQVYAGRESTWALGHSPAVDHAMPVKYFTERCLIRLAELHRRTHEHIVAPVKRQLTLESE